MRLPRLHGYDSRFGYYGKMISGNKSGVVVEVWVSVVAMEASVERP